jgi:hypothetical protein
VVEKIYSGRIRVFPSEGGALIYKLPLMGLCKLKVQINYGPQMISSNRDEDKNKRRKVY